MNRPYTQNEQLLQDKVYSESETNWDPFRKLSHHSHTWCYHGSLWGSGNTEELSFVWDRHMPILMFIKYENRFMEGFGGGVLFAFGFIYLFWIKLANLCTSSGKFSPVCSTKSPKPLFFTDKNSLHTGIRGHRKAPFHDLPPTLTHTGTGSLGVPVGAQMWDCELPAPPK